MKIVFTIPSLNFGGAERVVSVLANELVKCHEVSIILTSGNIFSAYPLDEKVNLHALPSEKGALKSWLEYRKICKNIAPNVNFAFMTETGIMSALFLAGTGIPVVISERNDPTGADQILNLKFKILNMFAQRLAKYYVFQSEGAKSYYPKSVQKKSCIILNPLEVEKLPQRDYSNIDNRIVSVGRLHPQKNHSMLIKAFAQSKSKDTHTLHIYGEGVLRAELEKLVLDLGISDKVYLEGNSKTVHNDIKNAKLFAFTSDYEGLPNALMEAMAIGVPCVSTDCSPGGARMLIDNGENGALIPCGDIAALSATFDNLLNDSVALAKYSANGQGLKERVSVENISRKWLECIDQMK
ncbi:MAG: glycosyltransferase [Oscillospiraceae bacterium]|nr:glycosyltransferase [Oscillospiraceae bacterium]